MVSFFVQVQKFLSQPLLKLSKEKTQINTDIYPLTVVADRFNGTYSNGKFTAWNCNPCNVPEEIYTRDDAFYFWSDVYTNGYDRDVPNFGIGNTIEEAISNLVDKLNDRTYFKQDTEIKKENKIEIDAKSLGCPCYTCSDFNEKLQRCKDIQKDCITYGNWYLATFKN